MSDSGDRIPDKCTHCGLRVFLFHPIGPLSGTVDHQFQELHKLKAAGIIRSVPRRKLGVSLGSREPDTTEFCAVDAPAWGNVHTPCKYWTQKIQGAELAAYLAIYHTRKNQEIAVLLGVLAVVVAVVIAIVQLSI